MRTYKLAIVGVAVLFVLAACSVNVKKNEEGQDKNVDIKTPFAEIHVDKGADVRDTGLPVYAGAVPKQNTENDDKNANVDISGFGYGVKVVAVSYDSNDPPSKLIAYYKDQLKRYGTVLECHTSNHNWGANRSSGHESDELTCDANDNGKTIELKAGKKNNQHIVAIDPKDKGSEFALVYVRLRGKDDTI